VKICPDCSCDFLDHVEKCARCDAVLVSFEDHARRQEEKRSLLETALEDQAVVREGEVKWLSELADMLLESGIPCRIHSDPGCAGSCRGNTCQLIVSRRDLERAHLRIEDYFAEMHPEVLASREMMGEGKCPACGSAVGSDEAECPDCGLALLIIE
jgi:hypothetical protein